MTKKQVAEINRLIGYIEALQEADSGSFYDPIIDRLKALLGEKV